MSDYIVVHSVRVCKSFTPKTFGRLTTVGPRFLLKSGRKRHAYQVCVCDCGEYTVVQPNTAARSCGCLHREVISRNKTIHGGARDGATTVEYVTWTSMLHRCGNVRSKNYGGRGITVCDRWREPNGQGFMNFLADMGPRPGPEYSIDRYPNKDGNYEPGNVRWATDKEQSRNKRNNVYITYNGKTQCLSAWAEEHGLSYACLSHRLKTGIPFEVAIASPPARRKNNG